MVSYINTHPFESFFKSSRVMMSLLIFSLVNSMSGLSDVKIFESLALVTFTPFSVLNKSVCSVIFEIGKTNSDLSSAPRSPTKILWCVSSSLSLLENELISNTFINLTQLKSYMYICPLSNITQSLFLFNLTSIICDGKVNSHIFMFCFKLYIFNSLFPTDSFWGMIIVSEVENNIFKHRVGESSPILLYSLPLPLSIMISLPLSFCLSPFVPDEP
mmetsp:Transcript_2911/g.3240  ORF Transcript_2911/g.3240 Transcript_2911/m.3240 type:complete len:216 (-) Transcript_2911:132-779(-)